MQVKKNNGNTCDWHPFTKYQGQFLEAYSQDFFSATFKAINLCVYHNQTSQTNISNDCPSHLKYLFL